MLLPEAELPFGRNVKDGMIIWPSEEVFVLRRISTPETAAVPLWEENKRQPDVMIC
jgi:hypothetical protein